MPPAALLPFVRCVWTLRGEGDPARTDRILPDGSFEVIFHRGEPFTRDGERQPRAMLVGEICRPTLVAASRDANVLGIRFRLGGLGTLTGLHARELRDGIHDLRDVLGEDEPEGVLAMLSRRRGERVDRRLSAAVSAIVTTDGRIRIRELAERAGTTERTLERLFDRLVGLRPKELARLARFQASLRGVDDGYYDDAHRVHEFQQFAGAPPSVVFAERSEITDAFVGNLQDDAAAGDR